MAIEAGGLHHLSIRVTDLARAKTVLHGDPRLPRGAGVGRAGAGHCQGTLIGIRGNAPETEDGDTFDPFRVGFDHVALAAHEVDDLERLSRQLDEAAVPNNGVQDDELTKAKYIRFYDPDGITWELYAMPE